MKKFKSIDVFINKKDKDLSRTRIKNLILSKQLRINDKIIFNPSKISKR